MPKHARTFVTGVVALGIALVVLAFLQPLPEVLPWITLALLTACTALANFRKALGPNQQAWNVNLTFIFAGVFLLPPQLFAWQIIIAYALEAIVYQLRRNPYSHSRYAQPFNAAVHLIAGLVTQHVYRVLVANNSSDAVVLVLAAMAAAAIYLLLDHYLVGQAIVLIREISWRDLEIFDSESLLLDATQLAIGYLIAILWKIEPLMVLPALVPLLLVYRSLVVPQLKREAQTDEKTGLLNIRRWRVLALDEIYRAQRDGNRLTLLMADLDLLRYVNNSFGHLAGDLVLKEVGRVLQEHVREQDIVGRFGGEEFVILLPGTGLEEGRAVAERLRRAIEENKFEVQTTQSTVKVTMSLGVATLPADGRTLEELIHQADLAMLQAKLSGRNRVAMASDVPHSLHVDDQPKQPSEVNGTSQAPTPAATLPDGPSLPAAPFSDVPPSASIAPASPRPATRTTPSRPVIALVATTASLALLLTILGFLYNPTPDLKAILIFTVLAIIAEVFGLEIYGSNSVSVGTALLVAVALTAGLPGLTVVSAAMALVHFLRRRPAFYKTIFNWATDVLAGSVFILVQNLLEVQVGMGTVLLLLLPVVLASSIFFIVETGLVAVAFTLSGRGNSVIATWKELFQWLAGNYIVLGIMGLFLAMSYVALGLTGVIVFVMPVAMMHLAQRQYLEQTKKSTSELRRMNTELAAANQEIEAATRSMRQLNDDLFLTLSRVIDARDPYVLGHANQVAEYAVAIARALGLPAEQVTSIRQAGLLHDLGKIAISDHVLHKPGKLTDEEYEYVKTHVNIGATMLENSQSLRHLVPIIRHHHERWDGTGYPDRLRGEAIPYGAQIIAVCDAVEAMASDRPYSRAHSLPEIISEVKRCAGTQFAPKVVEALVHVVEQEGAGLIINSARKVVQAQEEMSFVAGRLVLVQQAH